MMVLSSAKLQRPPRCSWYTAAATTASWWRMCMWLFYGSAYTFVLKNYSVIYPSYPWSSLVWYICCNWSLISNCMMSWHIKLSRKGIDCWEAYRSYRRIERAGFILNQWIFSMCLTRSRAHSKVASQPSTKHLSTHCRPWPINTFLWVSNSSVLSNSAPQGWQRCNGSPWALALCSMTSRLVLKVIGQNGQFQINGIFWSSGRFFLISSRSIFQVRLLNFCISTGVCLRLNHW